MSDDEKNRWDAAVENLRIREKRRELSNGEIFARMLEDGLPTRGAPTEKKKRPRDADHSARP